MPKTLLSRALSRLGYERRSTPDEFDDAWYNVQVQNSSSGVVVDHAQAMRTSAVYACVRVLSTTVAQLPFMLYRRTETGRDRADDHPLYAIVHDQPNPETTAYTFWETLMGALVLRGNAYAYKERDRLKRVLNLWQFNDPDRMTVTRDRVTDQLVYTYQPPVGAPEVYRPDEILHLRGLSADGAIGYSMLEVAREAIGLASAAEGMGSRLFAGDATPTGTLEHPGKLGPDGAKNLKDAWNKAHLGKRQIAVLEEGMKYTRISITPEESQFLETRVFQISDIARIFGVPPHLIGELSKATYSNIREQSAEFVKYGLMPWLIRIAQECNKSLLTPDERREYYFEHLTDALMRAAQKERYEGYALARYWGWMNANEIRRSENEPPLPGKEGTMYLVPNNTMPASAVSQEKPTGTTPNEPEPDEPEDEPEEDEADES